VTPEQEEAWRRWAYIIAFIGGCLLGLALLMGWRPG
jgi:hypothetical protein